MYSVYVQKFGSLFMEHILLYTYNNKDIERGEIYSLYILALRGSTRDVVEYGILCLCSLLLLEEVFIMPQE